MQLTGGYPFWLIKDGLINSYPKLLKNISNETVIIGGGISGALTAYYLLMQVLNVFWLMAEQLVWEVLVQAHLYCNMNWMMPLHLLKKKVGNENAERAYQLCGNSIDTIDSNNE